MYTRQNVIRPKRNEFLGIHYLWRRFIERDKKRKDKFWDWVKDLPNHIHFVEGKAIIQYTDEKGKIKEVLFEVNDKKQITFKHITTEDKRQKNLEFLTQDENLSKLGSYFYRKYTQIQKSTIRESLYNKMWRHIEKNLREDGKSKYLDHKPVVITVKVDNYEYLVKSQRRDESWVDYEFLGEKENTVIEIK